MQRNRGGETDEQRMQRNREGKLWKQGRNAVMYIESQTNLALLPSANQMLR
jgi:hypothetical protein